MDDHITKTVAVYNTIANQYSQKIKNLVPTKELEKFVTLMPQKGKVLDVGCAAGRDSLFFSQKDFAVTGIDLSDKLLTLAKSFAPRATFLKADIRQLPFDPECFHGIWASAVLLHLKRREIATVLNKFHNVLKKDGLLYISLKMGHGEHHVSETLSSHIPRFFTFYQPNEVRALLEQCNFHVLELYTWDEHNKLHSDREVTWIACFARKI